jgi:DNA-binding GntR family transcriptional regulator
MKRSSTASVPRERSSRAKIDAKTDAKTAAATVPETGGRKQIVRGNLHDEVAAVLRDMIIQDELPPGTHIPESDLCAQLGISRTPLREAIRVLASEGLVKPLPRRGAVVATPTPDEIQGLFLAIGAIESVCAQLACVNFSPAEIENILKLHKRLVQLHANGQGTKEYFRTNLAIHQAIVRGARNTFLAELHQSLSVRILRARFFVDMPKAAWARVMVEHGQIAALVQKRDGHHLSELLLAHMMGSWRDFEVTLERSRVARSFLSK